MSNFSLNIKASTWNRDSYNLYDYESRSTTKSNITVKETSCLYRHGRQITSYVPTNLPQENQTKLLIQLLKHENHFLLISPSQAPSSQAEEELWLCIKGMKVPQNKYRLGEGDIIRLGRVQMRVKEVKGYSMSSKQNEVQALQLSQGGLGQSFICQENSEKPLVVEPFESEGACRICLSEEETEEDPLIHPCKCSGTMGLVHLFCLKHWLTCKVACKQHNNSCTYSWKNLQCELCKMRYPHQLEIKGVICDIIGVAKPENNYVVLEAIGSDPNAPKTLYVINLDKKETVKLGRGHESDIRISDISVSRNHAVIRVTRTGLYLEDNESKFGTLVRINKPIILNKGSNLCVQAGRSLIQFNFKKNFKLLSCFSCGKANGESTPESREHSMREITEEGFQSNP